MTGQILDKDIDLDTLEEPSRGLGWLLTIGGAVGLLAAFILTVDKLTLLQDKIDGTTTQLSCNLNAFVSCSSVIGSPESHAFGFANSLLGLIGFSIVVMLGVLVVSRTPLPAFVWAGIQAGVILGIGFVTWLQWQSIYDIGKLCPWCMVVWTVTIPIFVVVTARNLRAFAPANGITRFVTNWTGLIIALWYVALLGAIWFKFGTNLWA